MRVIQPTAWRAVDVEELEPAAEDTVRSNSNTVVVAGPGAGKTELLAQRACYLLQTGLCRDPQRILAISFKRDAAKNLRERVQRRTDLSLSRRFDSLTFDAFAKGLLDRFVLALPASHRPPDSYEIQTLGIGQEIDLFLDFVATHHADRLAQCAKKTPGEVADKLRSIKNSDFERDHLLGRPLPASEWMPTSVMEWAAVAFWKDRLRPKVGRTSYLTFPMVGRLAELILRTNPGLVRALRLTYSHIFLDEFQDTTHVHYDLLKTSFLGSRSILTAVGDNKQRIMGWAMALADGLKDFERDFNASSKFLVTNYRSAPALVEMQHCLMRRLDPTCTLTRAPSDKAHVNGVCELLQFPERDIEARYIADLVADLVNTQGRHPQDVCVLTKQKPEQYASELRAALARHGIKLRVEVSQQDLLAEPLTDIVVALLRVAFSRRAGRTWADATTTLCETRGLDPEDEVGTSQVETELRRFIPELRMAIEPATDNDAMRGLLIRVMEFVGTTAFRQLHPQYRRGAFYSKTLESIADGLASSRGRTNSWAEALDDFLGIDSVPMMTIHKSKGLEYHTVIFLGLEDRAFWNFQKQSDEDTRAFFVAFSRAKEQVLFTYCRERSSNARISDLYTLLADAGVRPRLIQE